MPTVDNFSAWIEVEGKQLPEYGVQSSANGSQLIRTCWVPSEAGKEFKIVYKDSLGEIDTGTKLLVDGVRCMGQIKRRSRSVAIHEGESASATTYKPYVFSNRQLTEDEVIVGPATASLGEIVLDVEQVVVNEIKPWSDTQLLTDLPPLIVHERAKKGIVHGTQLGKEVPTSIAIRTAANAMSIRKLVSFRFKYRPLDILKADGIIPQDKPKLLKRQADPEDIIDLTADDDCQPYQCGARSRKKARVTKGVFKTGVKKESPSHLEMVRF